MGDKYKKPTNIRELNDFILDALTDLRNNNIPPEKAKEVFNGAGKAINAQKVQLEYAALRKEKPTIEFLAGGDRGQP